MANHSLPMAAIFPGQGSQEKGMGKDLAEAESAYMDLWKTAEDESGAPLREIYWDGEAADMADTRHLQPALTVVNMSFWMAAHRKLEPQFLAGHSLGEFAALFAAGALSIRDTLRAVSIRGRLMAESASGGAMAAILKLSLEQVEDIVTRTRTQTGLELRVANYNSPAQFVISGEKEAVRTAGDLAKEAKGRSVPLPVSGAFHSPLMNEAASEFASVLKKLDWSVPKTPVIFNATADVENAASTVLDIMTRQMTSSVHWLQTVQYQWDHDVRTWIELGPKGVLSRLVNAILSGQDDSFECVNLASKDQLDAF